MLRRTTKPIVVAVVGHVNQGKTTLWEAIRGSNHPKKEGGCITQNIGTYSFQHGSRHLILVDTPGHEALVSIRDFGATLADIVVIVVGLDTTNRSHHEVISASHIEASRRPVLIVLNKIDRFPTQVQEVESSIRKLGIRSMTPKGNERFIRLSALEGIGIRQLLDTINQEVETKSVPLNVPAQGTVVDSSVSVRTGITAVLLIQLGTLEVGATILVGTSRTKVRALRNEFGLETERAGPHHLITILGLPAVPAKGVRFLSVRSDRRAKEILAGRKQPQVSKPQVSSHCHEVADLFRESRCHLGCFILKARTVNLLEAVGQLFQDIEKKCDAELKIISKSLGPITAGDVKLAAISKARIVALGLSDHRPSKLLGLASIRWKSYSLIFDIAADIELELKNLRKPKPNLVPASEAKVRRLFGKVGTEVILGCVVLTGRFQVGQRVSVRRSNREVGSCWVRALRRYKESIQEVKAKEECGISVLVDQGVELQVGDALLVQDGDQS